MSADFDPDAAMAQAVANGRPAQDQADILNDAAYICYQAADKVKGIVPHERAWEACLAIDRQADFVTKNLDEINRRIFGDGALPTGGYPPGQKQSDRVYADTYFQYFPVDPNDAKARAALEAAYHAVVKEILDEGMTPSRRARRDALWDDLQGKPFDPPFLQPGYPPRGKPDPNEDPYGSDDGSEMSAAAVSERRAPRRGRDRGAGPMPIIAYWLFPAPGGPTMHFAATCPACPPDYAAVEELAAPEQASALAQRLRAHVCGTCLRIQAADEANGFLFGAVVALRALRLFRDHVEFETPGFLGIGAKNLSVAANDIRGIRFAGSRNIVIISTAQGNIRMPLRSAAEVALAREAFRRAGLQLD